MIGLLLLAGACAPREASVPALKARLDAQSSATAALQQGCAVPIRVRLLPGAASPSAEVLSLLGISRPDQLRVRHVRLVCGSTALSDAWNWYVPERLTPEMNRVLDTTDTPFGRAVAATHFRRQRLAGTTEGLPPGVVLENRGLLRRAPDDSPIALVVEDYLPEALRMRKGILLFSEEKEVKRLLLF